MRKLMHILLFGAAAAMGAYASPVMEKPVHNNLPTSFAIVIDSATYVNVKPSLMRYRNAVESDGLATYILSADWSNADEVRGSIKSLYKSDPRLEGVVLIGDIPVPMLRNAQHMTTAFKMDEDNFPIMDSSVPSDRFYDDFDLVFRFLKQDSAQPLFFYYELDENSPQVLSPDIYSARIRYPELRGGEKYKAISAFLDKAAKAKNAMKSDKLDHLTVFNGHGYNSDCQIVWIDAEKAYRENFPLAFVKGDGFRYLNYRMRPVMKTVLFEELLRPDVDLFMFHEHGGPTTQYINGGQPGDSFSNRYNGMKASIYSRMQRAIRRGADRAETQKKYSEDYNLNDDFFKDFDNPEYWVADSLASAAINIEAEEFHNRLTYPKMVMFNACYNGSFNEPDYIAGEYLFNDGGTLVAQGNTRNVLQDRWTTEMVGLLSHGMRAGHYNRMVATLEGHLMGDPTLRFAPVEANNIAADITLRKNDTAYWKSLLNSPYADVQCLALRMLADNDTARTMSPMLLDTYRKSRHNVVRMEAVKLLSRYNNADFLEAVRLGVNDPYELVARLSAGYAGDIGDKSLLPAMIEGYIDGSERARVRRTLGTSLSFFPADDVIEAVNGFYAGAGANRWDAENEKKAMIAWVNRQTQSSADNNSEMNDSTLRLKSRIQAIRSVRNNTYHQHLDVFMNLIADDTNPEALRVNMTEALGWFNHSWRRPEIIAFCRSMLDRKDLPKALRAELTQTINRLS